MLGQTVGRIHWSVTVSYFLSKQTISEPRRKQSILDNFLTLTLGITKMMEMKSFLIRHAM